MRSHLDYGAISITNSVFLKNPAHFDLVMGVTLPVAFYYWASACNVVKALPEKAYVNKQAKYQQLCKVQV